MSLLALLKPNGPSGFGYASTADDVTAGLSLAGKTFLVTGCNSGLGAEAVRVLAARGAKVIGTARTVEKAREALAGVAGEPVPVACELSEPSSIRAAVTAVKDLGARLDGLIANAGVMALPTLEQKYGYEAQFFTNHVGHFILVTGLLDQLTDVGRVVMLSSGAHRYAYREGIRLDDLAGTKGYSALGAYGQSKLANLLFALHLSKRMPQPSQTANSVHPGVIATNLSRHMNPVLRGLFSTLGPPLVLKTVPQGTATEVYVVANPAAATVSGEYWADCNVAKATPHGRDAALAAALWSKTEEIVAGLA